MNRKGEEEKRGLADLLQWAWVLPPLLVVLLLLGAGCSRWGVGGRDGTWQQVQEERLLRVGMDASYPPFEWIDEQGEFVGYDVDLARELARRWRVDIQFVDIHFDGLYDALRAEKVDLLVSALPYDRTLTQDFLYSESYFNAGQVLVVSQEDASIRAVADLEGKRVGVQLGARAHQLVLQLIRDEGLSVEVVTGRQPEETFSLLREGDVDVLVCDRVTAHEHVAGEEFGIVEPPLTNAPFVIAARADSPRLMKEVNEALDAWRESGFLRDLEERWLR